MAVSPIWAQAIETQPLPVTSICAGSTLDVTAVRTGGAGDISVELSADGMTYTQVPSVFLATVGRYELIYRVTIPASTPAGSTYRLRFVSQVPPITGSPSPTVLTVLAQPAAPTTQAIVVCQGTAAPMLQVSGQNVRWYADSTYGTGSATAPTVNTAQVGRTTYYVTQSVNGCESRRAALPVTINSLPTLSVSGTTTINLGQETTLKLSFMGGGPYRYGLSNGLSGTATQDTTITVLPAKTTTYQSTSISNVCGTGNAQSGATATVTVQSPTIQTLSFTTTTLCAGSSLSTNFLTSGTFTTGSVFTLQLARYVSDSSQIAFVDVPNAQVANGQITGTLPTTLTAGNYLVRVTATNPKIPVYGTVSPTLLTIRSLPNASLTNAGSATINAGQSVSLTIGFAGSGPWTYAYTDSSATGVVRVSNVPAAANPTLLVIRPQQTTVYTLTSVNNACGAGTITARTVTVVVNPVLGLSEKLSLDALSVYPLPATAALTVSLPGVSARQPATLELLDLNGTVRQRQETRQPETVLGLDTHPTGTYLLRVQLGDRSTVRRILKR